MLSVLQSAYNVVESFLPEPSSKNDQNPNPETALKDIEEKKDLHTSQEKEEETLISQINSFIRQSADLDNYNEELGMSWTEIGENLKLFRCAIKLCQNLTNEKDSKDKTFILSIDRNKITIKLDFYIEKILNPLVAKIDLNQEEELYSTPINSAGNVDILKFLISKGANINHNFSADGTTPIFNAVVCGRTDMVRYLLEDKEGEKADHTVISNDGKNLYHIIAENHLDDPVRNRNLIPIFTILAQYKDLDINAPNEKQPAPLYLALINKPPQFKLIRAFMYNGANLQLAIKGNEGKIDKDILDKAQKISEEIATKKIRAEVRKDREAKKERSETIMAFSPLVSEHAKKRINSIRSKQFVGKPIEVVSNSNQNVDLFESNLNNIAESLNNTESLDAVKPTTSSSSLTNSFIEIESDSKYKKAILELEGKQKKLNYIIRLYGSKDIHSPIQYTSYTEILFHLIESLNQALVKSIFIDDVIKPFIELSTDIELIKLNESSKNKLQALDINGTIKLGGKTKTPLQMAQDLNNKKLIKLLKDNGATEKIAQANSNALAQEKTPKSTFSKQIIQIPVIKEEVNTEKTEVTENVRKFKEARLAEETRKLEESKKAEVVRKAQEAENSRLAKKEAEEKAKKVLAEEARDKTAKEKAEQEEAKKLEENKKAEVVRKAQEAENSRLAKKEAKDKADKANAVKAKKVAKQKTASKVKTFETFAVGFAVSFGKFIQNKLPPQLWNALYNFVTPVLKQCQKISPLTGEANNAAKIFAKSAAPFIFAIAAVKGLYTLIRDLKNGKSIKASLADATYESGSVIIESGASVACAAGAQVVASAIGGTMAASILPVAAGLGAAYFTGKLLNETKNTIIGKYTKYIESERNPPNQNINR